MADSEFQVPEDIANRALQICGAPHITLFTDLSEEAHETSTAYDKVRMRELRRNTWVFSTRRAILRPVDLTTLIWTPPAYSSATTYALGQVVIDGAGHWWESLVAGNVGNIPSAENENWGRYFGPVTMDPFSAPPNLSVAPPAAPVLSAVTSGSLGASTLYVKLTYVTALGESLPSVESKISLLTNQVGSTASPAAATGATGYNVYASNVQGVEMLQNSSPIAIGTPWQEPNTGLVTGQFVPTTNTVPFFSGELTFYGGAVYRSLTNNNSDTPPSINWLAMNGTTAALKLLYPMGVGPLSNITTRNVYYKPHGWLKKAVTDPKGDAYLVVGVPTGPQLEDWVEEATFIISANMNPMLVRFVANFIDVALMDPMFCEGFAAALADDVSPNLHSAEPNAKARARTRYKEVMGEAREANGIEEGAKSPPVDPWIACRL